ncbi:hypothetical protein Hanom_Chr00s000005g01612331 [Helianthus anomalus]
MYVLMLYYSNLKTPINTLNIVSKINTPLTICTLYDLNSRLFGRATHHLTSLHTARFEVQPSDINHCPLDGVPGFQPTMLLSSNGRLIVQYNSSMH